MTPTAYSPDDKIYQIAQERYSIHDLLLMANSPEYVGTDGFPRISDFHFKVGMPVRVRLDHQLLNLAEAAPLTQEAVERLILPLLAPEAVARLRERRDMDVDASYQMPGSNCNYRLNVFHDRDGMAAVLRILTLHIPTIESIGFPQDIVWREIVGLKQGLVLVTGVTGSGKSTTIASLLQHINQTRPARVITLEDPVEYVFSSQQALFSQREVGTTVHSFASGLRSAVRENPDIIYVGEIRDHETAALALSAVETGHLVFSTLHTRDTVGALTRILDMMPGDRIREVSMQLSFALSYVIGQKLVPLSSGHGRCAAFEVLRTNSGLENIIRTGNWSQIPSIIETNLRDGMRQMERSLVELVVKGRISEESALMYANDPDLLRRLLESVPRKGAKR